MAKYYEAAAKRSGTWTYFIGNVGTKR